MGPFGSLTEAVLGDIGGSLDDSSGFGFGLDLGDFGNNVNFAGDGGRNSTIPYTALAIGALALVLILRK